MKRHRPRCSENTRSRSCWGYTFELTGDHMSPEEAHRLKFSWDGLADEALCKLNEIISNRAGLKPRVDSKGSKGCLFPVTDSVSGAEPTNYKTRDLYEVLRDNANNDPTLGKLWKEVNSVPDWVGDWSQISRGQEVFYRYGGPALNGLAFQSLLGGLGAARVVETLSRTGGFSTKVARHRLFETTQYILQCTRSLTSIQPGGEGFASCVRVRLLHAAVRSRILRLAATRSEYYNVEALGVPINDLDCIATIGSFSATLVWLALPRQGIYLKQGEIVDFIALFRYIGYVTGAPSEYFSTPEKARKTMESLLLTEIQPTNTSRILAHNVIESLVNQPPGYPSKAFLEATARWLNGDELSDALGLGHSNLYYKSLVAGQCLFFMIICYCNREIPMLDRRKTAALRKAFWFVVVDGKHGLRKETFFEFRHVPALDKSTKSSKAAHVPASHKVVERRNLLVFMTFGGLLCACAFLGLKLLATMFNAWSKHSGIMQWVYAA